MILSHGRPIIEPVAGSGYGASLSVSALTSSEETLVAAALGWLGTLGTFIAYILLVRGRITPASSSYAAMNVLGGVFCGSASVVYHAWPSVASNFVWSAVGIHTLLVSLRRRAALVRARRRAARAAAAGAHSRVILRSRRRVHGATSPRRSTPEQRHDRRGPSQRRSRRTRSHDAGIGVAAPEQEDPATAGTAVVPAEV